MKKEVYSRRGRVNAYDEQYEEKETIRKSKRILFTANGTITTTEEATVYVRDLDMCITVQLLEDSQLYSRQEN